jgi:hypothetical protein
MASDSKPGPDTPRQDPLVQAITTRLLSRLPQVLAEVLAESGLHQRIEELTARLGSSGKAASEPKAAPQPSTAPPDGADQEGSRVCSEPGCDQPARARGLCSKHYQRLRYAEKRALERGRPAPASLAEARAERARLPIRKTEKRGGGLCSQAGCERPNYAKGMCGKHFMEWVRSKKSESD